MAEQLLFLPIYSPCCFLHMFSKSVFFIAIYVWSEGCKYLHISFILEHISFIVDCKCFGRLSCSELPKAPLCGKF